MSRRNRHRRGPEGGGVAQAELAGAAVAPSNALYTGAQVGGGSGFAGANFSTRRGFIYFPTLETNREVDTYSRLELIRRARWLKRNVGFSRRCINGAANMVGYLSPRALTRDKAWNDAAEKAWESRAGSAVTFDRLGKFNVYGYQPLITRSRLLDGDFLSVFTSSQSGGAMVMSYEGHQIANALIHTGQDGWRDGVRTDSLGRAIAYRLVNPDDPAKFTDIATADCVLNADFDSYGWNRGVSGLHHAINHLLDATELQSDLKLGSKIANRIGYYLTTAAPGGSSGKPMTQAGTNRTATNVSTRGNEKIVMEDMVAGKVPMLNAGEEIKQLLDQRPHPNTIEFLEHMNRDNAYGFGMSPDVLWNIAKLGGASVRYVLADAQIWVTQQQQLLVDQFLTRFWVYFVAKEMKAGRLARCEDPEWWMVGWTPPAKLTVDIARDGKLSIDLHRSGMLTLKRWYAEQGLDSEPELRQQVEEYCQKVMLCRDASSRYGFEVDPDKVWPPAPGSAPVQAANEPDPDFADPEQITRVAA